MEETDTKEHLKMWDIIAKFEGGQGPGGGGVGERNNIYSEVIKELKNRESVPKPKEPPVVVEDDQNINEPRRRNIFRCPFPAYTNSVQVVQPYLGLIFLSLLAICLGILLYVAAKWIALLVAVNYSIPHTFAWELIIQVLGSHYENCLNASTPNQPLVMTVRSWKNCSFDFTFPWIPLAGSIISLQIVLLAVIGFAILVFLKRPARWCLNLMILVLCPLECIYFGYSICQLYKTVGLSSSNFKGADYVYLTSHMWATLSNPKDQFPDEIHPQWETTQTTFKCCGVSGPSNWRFRMFRTGDPRLPKSCVNADFYTNPEVWQFRFPTRFEVWTQDCRGPELETVREYSYEQLTLLILNNFAALAAIMFTLQLAAFLEHRDRNFTLVPVELSQLLGRFRIWKMNNNKEDENCDQNQILAAVPESSKLETLV